MKTVRKCSMKLIIIHFNDGTLERKKYPQGRNVFATDIDCG